MSFGGSPPSPPNPSTTSNTQMGYNTQAAQAQNLGNEFNQYTPFGSLVYSPGANGQGGSVTQTLSPQEQGLLSGYQGIQGNIQQGLNTLTAGMPGVYSNLLNQQQQGPPSSADVTNQMMGWQQSYMNPIYQQQQNKLNAQLQNQGISPGSEAWNNAQNLQARNVADANNQFFMQAQPQAYSEAMQSYQAPFQTAQALTGMGTSAMTGAAPQTTLPLAQTPTAQIQPPNFMGATQADYNAQLAQYQQQQQGMWGLANAGLNGIMGLGKAGLSAGLG